MNAHNASLPSGTDPYGHDLPPAADPADRPGATGPADPTGLALGLGLALSLGLTPLDGCSEEAQR
ncbi:hypothetical protein ABT095_07950 [Kitasatospora sp. NPDC002227]|uniref:hypothetical protein n=1 Tax=Kitasatospora sp. NPDC002227 TaxID=3154773 RepID=UPI00331EBE86